MVTHIVAVQEDGGIGKDGKLLHRYKDDMAWFQRQTMGSVILMGRKTWESLPGHLPGRINVVLTHGEGSYGDATFRSVDKALEWCETTYPTKPVFVIGGAEIYKATLHLTHQIFLTKFHGRGDPADTFYPDIPDRFAKVNAFKDDNNVEFMELFDVSQY